jgi:RimJ/RimL family protein N-acetyltransferase
VKGPSTFSLVTATPVLTVGRFELRPWSSGDLDFVIAAASDAAIGRFSSVGTATSPAAALEWLGTRTEPGRRDWVVVSADEPIGRVCLAHINSRDGVAEIGYWVLPEYRRQGVASASVAIVEEHAFAAEGLSRLVIRHEPENQASCALALSRGYLAEGTERGAFERRGARRDLHVHGLLAADRAHPSAGG